jgi:aminoglycoside phosphotransferase family enzyme
LTIVNSALDFAGAIPPMCPGNGGSVAQARDAMNRVDPWRMNRAIMAERADERMNTSVTCSTTGLREGDAALARKVLFLAQPQTYAEPTLRVDTVETHMSWVFLTDRHAWKLKKPVRQSYLDFSTEAARRHYCAEELRLNRRLARDVYLETVPLTVDADGRLRLGPHGIVVDWLVKMRRLPAERMLDRMIRSGAVHADDVRRVVGTLCRFYREATPAPLDEPEYRERFATGIASNRLELGAREFALPIDAIEPVCARQRAFLDRAAALFDGRVRGGHIVEAHGDLRPEHICLEQPPQIIDCLEFSLDFRILDTADELAFLALECERLGAAWMRQSIVETYAEMSGDAPPDALVHFYQSFRACVRAKIAIWHLKEPALTDPSKWTTQARDYLRLARTHVAHCNA